MKKRVRCPFHNEKTPSLVRRREDWYCYGSCAKAYSIEEVAKKGISEEYEEDEDREREDLVETFRYIKTLPTREIRGLRFPADSRGYYICWPDDSYYKYRLFNPGKGSKYIGPVGYRPPLFWAKKGSLSTLAIVEGEINALTVAKAQESWSVVSPGSATCFSSRNLSTYLTEFKKYNRVIVVLDDDPAGLKGFIEAKSLFLYKLPFVDYVMVPKPDLNERLCDGGIQKVQEVLQGTNRG